MSTAGKLFDTVFENAYKATEVNLRLQQELLLGGTRFVPWSPGRKVGSVGELPDFRQQFSHGIMSTARAQRELFDQQFDAAITAFDEALGVGKKRSTTPVVAELPPRVVVKDEPTPEAAIALAEVPRIVARTANNIFQKVAVVTGAASGIGEAVARELAHRGAKAVMLVDRHEGVKDLAAAINKESGRDVAVAAIGDTTDEGFRKRVFNEAMESYGMVTICVPAAGITRDGLAVRINKESGRAEIYPIESFRQVTEVNLLAPIYWGIEMVARIAEQRLEKGLKRWEPEETIQGVVVFLGSVSSQGNKGQISYAVAKAGLEGATATLTKEAIFHGVRCGIIHPGFTDTPMARALGEDFLKKNVLPYTQLRRLIRPDEIADAICFMISNSAVSGELWADAGWHPPA